MMTLDNEKLMAKLNQNSFLYACLFIICFVFTSISLSGNAFAGGKCIARDTGAAFEPFTYGDSCHAFRPK